MEIPDYETICRLVGKLFLESQTVVNHLKQQHDTLYQELKKSQLQVAELQGQVKSLLEQQDDSTGTGASR